MPSRLCTCVCVHMGVSTAVRAELGLTVRSRHSLVGSGSRGRGREGVTRSLVVPEAASRGSRQARASQSGEPADQGLEEKRLREGWAPGPRATLCTGEPLTEQKGATPARSTALPTPHPPLCTCTQGCTHTRTHALVYARSLSHAHTHMRTRTRARLSPAGAGSWQPRPSSRRARGVPAQAPRSSPGPAPLPQAPPGLSTPCLSSWAQLRDPLRKPSTCSLLGPQIHVSHPFLSPSVAQTMDSMAGRGKGQKRAPPPRDPR